MSSPFDNRYGSNVMRQVFSDDFKFQTWRLLWVILAKVEKELGLDISDQQIEELELNVEHIDYQLAEEHEKKTHHDVMAHILTYGDQCPNAKPIIHLGATSCFVTDNTDVIQQRYALILVRQRLIDVICSLIQFADKFADVPTIGYTHFQVAQPTTIGKRACMWLQDFVMDLDELEHQLIQLKMLGCKGATGTAASFLELFDGDEDKVKQLEQKISKCFECKSFPISGQTYTRKQDFNVMQVLASIAQSASKFANDIRLLSNLGEITEPHSNKQVGSSAMPYKKNPIKCERINSLSRFVICNLQNFATTSSTQWLERTLDDSANRRVTIPETFMAIDEIFITLLKVTEGLNVDTIKVCNNLTEKLPYLLTEPLLMYLVKKGGDRQEIHESLRQISSSAQSEAQLYDMLIDTFGISTTEIKLLKSRLTGMAEQQTKEYLYKLKARFKDYE